MAPRLARPVTLLFAALALALALAGCGGDEPAATDTETVRARTGFTAAFFEGPLGLVVDIRAP